MRFIFFLILLSASIFSFKWIYEHGEGVSLKTECGLMKLRWSEKMSKAKSSLEEAPANVKLFLFDLLTEKDYFVENCELINAVNIDTVFQRAGAAYQNDPGNFQSFEHYRADLIERMEAIHFFTLKGALLSSVDYWEVSVRQALFLGGGPFQFNNDFTRRLAVFQSIISIFFFIFLFFPATKRLKRSGY